MRSCLLTLVLVCSGVAAAATPPEGRFQPGPGTVAAWNFDAGTGRTVPDVEVDGPVATLDRAEWTVGQDGHSAVWLGGTGAIDVALASLPGDALTVELWVKLDSASGDLVCLNPSFLLRLDGTLKPAVYVGGAWRHFAGRLPVPVKRWTHLAFSYDAASGRVRGYVNGQLDVDGSVPVLPERALTRGNGLLRIGGNTWSGGRVVAKVGPVRISSVVRDFAAIPNVPAPQARTPAAVSPKLVNGDFESGTYGWRPYGEGLTSLRWALETEAPARGLIALKSIRKDALSLASWPVAVHAEKLTLTLDLRADEESEHRVRLVEAGIPFGASRPPREFRKQVRVAAVWTHLSEEFTIPPEIRSVFVVIDKAAGRSLWIDGVRLTPDQSTAPDGPGLLLDLRKQGNTFRVGETAVADLALVNAGPAAALRVSVEVQPLLGTPVSRDLGPVTVPARTIFHTSFALDTSEPGSYEAQISAIGPNGSELSSRHFEFHVVQPPVGGLSAERFGMNAHPERDADDDLEVNFAVLARCGVSSVRTWWGWGMAEKEPGQFDWKEYDRQLALASDQGLRLFPVLLRYYPEFEHAWSGAMDRIQRPPSDVARWKVFVSTVVGRYGTRVPAYEIWNEPAESGIPASRYAELLSTSYDAAKNVDAHSTIVGFAGVGFDYLEGALAAGAAKHFDAISMHAYEELASPVDGIPKSVAKARELARGTGSADRIWLTEQGSAADGRGYVAATDDELTAAATLAKTYFAAFAAGVERVYWFAAHSSPAYGWGVFDDDYVPRPRLIALSALASRWREQASATRVDLDHGLTGYLFASASGTTLALVGGRSGLELTLPKSIAANVHAYDVLGHPLGSSPIRIDAGSVVYVDIAGSKNMVMRALGDLHGIPYRPITATARTCGSGCVLLRVQNESRANADAVVELGNRSAAVTDLPPWQVREFSFQFEVTKPSISVRISTGDGPKDTYVVDLPLTER